METITKAKFTSLAATGTQLGSAPSANRGVQGLIVDRCYLLPDGRVIEAIVRHGWLYEWRLWTAKAAQTEHARIPNALDKGWCG